MIPLEGRGLVKVSGPDASTFLNGLLTNDVTKANAKDAIYAALLTPQGKFLFDMFVLAPAADTYWLDVSRPRDFVARLSMYRLRSQVVIEDQSLSPLVNAFTFIDPRMQGLGSRTLGPSQYVHVRDDDLAQRMEMGVPDPAIDLLVEKDFAMEGLLDELGAIDFHKGCYVGQEMTSRMKRRTSVKNKLCRIRYNGPAPDFEMPILADNWEVGRMRSGVNGVGIAMIRFDRARKAIGDGQALLASGTEIRLDPPAWLIEPAPAS